jgi:hypothetical protein
LDRFGEWAGKFPSLNTKLRADVLRPEPFGVRADEADDTLKHPLDVPLRAAVQATAGRARRCVPGSVPVMTASVDAAPIVRLAKE